MNRAEKLAIQYGDHIAAPWQRTLSAAERTIFVVYHRDDDRRVRAALPAFETATGKAGKAWLMHDFTDFFPRWLQRQKYRDSYFENPEALQVTLESAFAEDAAEDLRSTLARANPSEETVVAVLGISCLFGFVKVSSVLGGVADCVPERCRLLVLFPGEYENHRYHLLGGREDWNYMATPICAREQ